MGFLPGRVGIGIGYGKIIKIILVGQFLPLAVALALNGLASSFATRALAPVRITTNIFMLAACVLVMVSEYKSLGLFGVKAVIGITMLFVSSALAGWWLGGPGTGLRKAVTLNTTIRNVPVAMVIVSGNFAGTPAVSATFVYSLFSTLGTMFLALLLRNFSPEPSGNPELPAGG
jgi:predicted Na+-dependent transporter